MPKTTLFHQVNRPLIVRQHVLTLAPDVALLLGGMTLLVINMLITRVMAGFGATMLRSLCQIAGMLFVGVGVGHILCWLGLYVVVDAHEIVIRRCWLQEHRVQPWGQGAIVRLEQTNWLDAALDKGTLIVYTPIGDVITIPNLANYSQLARLLE
jgi:hypothetical protein